MAKRILLGVLQDYFGRYIDGINSANLKVAVWAGKIDLEGLQLKKEALDSLRLPLQLQCGHIQTFQVFVPWTKLGSEPVRVVIDGIYILGKLAHSDTSANDGSMQENEEGEKSEGEDEEDFDSTNEEPSTASGSSSSRKRGAARRKRVPQRILEKRIRLRWANLLAAGSSEEEESEKHQGSESFWSRLGAKIMDNLQITITNVHVRIEDHMSIARTNFAYGITFEEFSTFTCDESGKPLFRERNNVTQDIATLFKMVKLKSLAVYLDSDRPTICNMPNAKVRRSNLDFVYLLSKGIWRKELSDSYVVDDTLDAAVQYRKLHHFLLLPSSPQVLVAKNESSDFSLPRYRLEVDFDQVNISVSQTQYAILAAVQRSLAQNSILSIYHEHRPPDAPLEDPRAWWKYAYKCVKIHLTAARLSRMSNTDEEQDESKPNDDPTRTEEALRKLTAKKKAFDWLEIVRQVKMREEYITLYKRSLKSFAESKDKNKDSSSPSHASLADQNRIQELEDELEVENTLAYRATTLAEVAAEQKKLQKTVTASNSGSESSTRQWLTSWFVSQEEGTVENVMTDHDSSQRSHELTAEERDELINAVNFFDSIQDHSIPDGTVHVLLKSKLRKGTVSLVDSDYARVLFRAQIGGSHTYEYRFGGNWKHDLVLKSLSLEDSTESNSAREKFLSPKLSKGSSNVLVVKVEFSATVFDANDRTVILEKQKFVARVAAVPFKVILQPRWVNGLSYFLTSREGFYTEFEQHQLHSIKDAGGFASFDPSSTAFTSPTSASSSVEFPMSSSPSTMHESSHDEPEGFVGEANWLAQYLEHTDKLANQLEEKNAFFNEDMRPNFDMRFTVAAPILLFPLLSKDPSLRSTNGDRILLLDLGNLKIERNDQNPSQTQARDRPSASAVSEDSQDQFFDALESELGDETNGNNDDVSDALDILPTLEGTRNRRVTSVSSSPSNYGTWKIEVLQIRSVILTVPPQANWETLYQSLDVLEKSAQKIENSSIFRVVDDFDVRATVRHFMSTRMNQTVDVALDQIKLTIVPAYVRFLWDLRLQWVKEPWWWLVIPQPGEDDQVEEDADHQDRLSTKTSSDSFGSAQHLSSSSSTTSSQDVALALPKLPVSPQPQQQVGFATHFSVFLTKFQIIVAADPAPKGVPGMTFLDASVCGLKLEFLQRAAVSYAHLGLESIDIIDLFANADRSVYFVSSSDPAFLHRQQSIPSSGNVHGMNAASSSSKEAEDEKKHLISIDACWRRVPVRPKTGKGASKELLETVKEEDARHPGHGQSKRAPRTKSTLYAAAHFHRLWIFWNPDTVVALRSLYAKKFPEIFPKRSNTPHESALSVHQLERATSSTSSSVASRDGGSHDEEEDLRFKVTVSLQSLSIQLRKHQESLVQLRVASANMKFTHDVDAFKVAGKLGSISVIGRDRELFSVQTKADALVSFVFKAFLKTKLNTLSVRIGASRYTHVNQIYLEILDYIREGISKAIFGSDYRFDEAYGAGDLFQTAMKPAPPKQKESVQTNYEVHMELFEFILPASMNPEEKQYLGASCTDLRAFNVPSTTSETRISLDEFRLFSDAAPILEKPVKFDLAVVVQDSGRLVVNGNISLVAVALTVQQYWMIQSVFSENLLADPVSSTQWTCNADEESQTSGNADQLESSELQALSTSVTSPIPPLERGESLVQYAYDSVEGPGLVFAVDIVLERATLLIAEGAEVEEKACIASFSMDSFRAHVFRDDPDACTVSEISVTSLDLIDKRKDTAGNWFKYLILSNPRASRKHHRSNYNEVDTDAAKAFFFRFVPGERSLRLDLNGFRSFFMIDLLSEVIQFWTSSDPAIEMMELGVEPSAQSAPNQRNSVAATEELPDWKGEFNLRDPCLCFVADFEDPLSKMVVIRSDIQFTWSKNGEPTRKLFSYWNGTLNNFEAYVATIQPVQDIPPPSHYWFQEVCHQQIMEPTAMTFSYEYEEVGFRSKVHTRRAHFMFGQLELYVSSADVVLIQRILTTLRGHQEESSLLEIRELKSRERFARIMRQVQIQRYESSRTITSEDAEGDEDDDDEEEVLFDARGSMLTGFIDEHYVCFVVPSTVRDLGVVLAQEHGFLRVHTLYGSRGQDGTECKSICEQFGVKEGDYLLEMDSVFVGNESVVLIQQRLACKGATRLLKFLRAESDMPVVLQDSLNAGTQKVILNFIDDLENGDLPLSNLVLGKIDCFVNGSNDGNYVFGAQVDMTGAHFYDLRAGSWGVLLEPCHVNTSCTYFNSGEVELTIDLPKPINCNLSDTFLRILKNTMTNYDSLSSVAMGRSKRALNNNHDSSKVNVDGSMNYAFLLENNTGLPLQFWKTGERQAASATFADVDAKDVSFGFLHHTGSGHGIIRGFCQYTPLTILFLYPDPETGDLEAVWEPLEGVVVNKIGGGVVRLIARSSRRDISPWGLKVKWRVEIDDASRKLKLILSSLLSISNQMDYSLRIMANSPTWGAGRSPPWSVGPKQVRNLPVLFGDAIEVRVQPMLPEHLEESASHSYDWSGPIHISLASGGSHTNTELACSLSNGKTRYMCASVEPADDGISTVFSVFPQVRFRNLLPQELVYQEFVPSISLDMAIGGGCIAPGDEKQLHSLPSGPEFGSALDTVSRLTLKLENSNWSEPVALMVPRKSKRQVMRRPRRYRKISFVNGANRAVRNVAASVILRAEKRKKSKRRLGKERILALTKAPSDKTLDDKDSVQEQLSSRTLVDSEFEDERGDGIENEDIEQRQQQETEGEDQVEGCDDDDDDLSIFSESTFEFDSELEDDEEDTYASWGRQPRALASSESSGEASPVENPNGLGRILFRDKAGNTCEVCVSVEEAEAGGILVIVFAECWIVNNTALSLRYSSESNLATGKSGWVVPTSLNSAKGNPNILMYMPEEGKLMIAHERSQGLEAVDVSTPGMNGAIVVPSNNKNDFTLHLGIAVDLAPGMLYRTNIVTIVPRFTFSNYTSCPLCFQPYTSGRASSMTWVSVGASVPFWCPGDLRLLNDVRFQIRFGKRVIEGESEADTRAVPTEWSQPFDPRVVLKKRGSVKVRLKRGNHFEFFSLDVQVGDTAGSILVELSEHDMEDLRALGDLESLETEGFTPRLDQAEVDEPSQGRQAGFFAKFPKVGMEFNVVKVQLNFLRDHAELAVFFRGIATARTERQFRVKERKASLLQEASSAGGKRKSGVFGSESMQGSFGSSGGSMASSSSGRSLSVVSKLRSQRPVSGNLSVDVTPTFVVRRSNLLANVVFSKLSFSFVHTRKGIRYALTCEEFLFGDCRSESVFEKVIMPDFHKARKENLRQSNFLELVVNARPTDEIGYDLDEVKMRMLPVRVCVDESFLIDILEYKTGLTASEDSAEFESAVFSIESVLGSQLTSLVGLAAKHWAHRKMTAEITTEGVVEQSDGDLAGQEKSVSFTSTVARVPRTGGQQVPKRLDMIKVKKLRIAEVIILLSYQQHKVKEKSSMLYNLGGGFLSRMNIRVEGAKLRLDTFERINFMGSLMTLMSAMRKHYQGEASKSMLVVLGAVDFRSTSFGITATLRNKLSLTSARVVSDEFPTVTFRSSDALLVEYRNRFRPSHGCSNMETFITLMRNFVFDWRNNHRFLHHRKLAVIAVVNRSSTVISTSKPSVNRLASCKMLVPHTETPSGQNSVLEAWQPGYEWNQRGYTGWAVYSRYKEGVSMQLSCAAFSGKISVPGDISISPQPGFSLSFLYRDTSSSFALYVVAVEDYLAFSGPKA